MDWFGEFQGKPMLAVTAIRKQGRPREERLERLAKTLNGQLRLTALPASAIMLARGGAAW